VAGLDLIGAVVALIGSAFLFLGALGVVRMPDLYNRMQAGTKATTLGNLLTLTGLGLMVPAWLPKILLIALFVLVTNPISSHALARAAHAAGIPLAPGSVKDALAADGGASRGLGDAGRASRGLGDAGGAARRSDDAAHRQDLESDEDDERGAK
jgi:multicomponent Na+:H+ antiporter subunit G